PNTRMRAILSAAATACSRNGLGSYRSIIRDQVVIGSALARAGPQIANIARINVRTRSIRMHVPLSGCESASTRTGLRMTHLFGHTLLHQISILDCDQVRAKL